jgi:hypothetical protein
MKMYCPVCEEEVQAKRENMNWAILILLTIFTAGIGTLIYLAIWLEKPLNRCITCNSLCYPSREAFNIKNVSNSRTSRQVSTTVPEKVEVNEEKSVFCVSCGAELDAKAHYCAYCGSNL